MKGILIAFTFITLNVSLSSQSYIPVLVEGNRYKIRKPLGLGQESIYEYSIVCDTVIENKNYKYAKTIDGRTLGLYYEDTISQIVYKRDETKEEDELYIEFDLNVGDSTFIFGNFQTVMDVTHELKFGRVRKIIHFDFLLKIIEGIGFNFCGVHSFGDFQVLIDFKEQSETCSSITNINEINNEKFYLYPNPAFDIINIDASQAKFSDYKLSLYNAEGKLLIIKNGSPKLLSLDGLANGIYVVKLESQKGSAFERLVVAN
jgi:hypothetical protein